MPADCVAWGNFSGGAALQTATGTSAGAPVSPSGIGAGQAIRRTVEPGCTTLLEDSDDSDDSLTDFQELAPSPRNNASAIVETNCAGAPNTTIDDRPPFRSNSTSAAFTYEAPTATSYECKLDGATFASCPDTGSEYTGLANGSHSFQVRGVNGSGSDPTPAIYTWTVDTIAPVTTIDTHPVDPSPGTSAAFTFHASETSTFKCSMVLSGQPDAFVNCSSGKTYVALADGQYTFKVRATDQATNLGAAVSFAWVVDNSLVDATPPETTITAKPPDPSGSASAAFAYASNEPGSSFQCSLDGSPFAACAAAGISYAGLANGLHSFQVRAVDTSANVDPTPAGYSFSVAVAPGAPVAGPPPPPAPPAGRPATPPQTTLTAKPAASSRDRTPTFRFRSNIAGASFECAVDKQPYKRCRSPFTTAPLKPGVHSVSIRARAGGLSDSSPAKFTFRIRGRG